MSKIRRILLNERASELLASMIRELRSSEPHLKITASKAASWIVTHFHEHYFDRSRSKMVDAHRDRKAHLKSLVERLHSDGDLNAVSELKSALREWEKKKDSSGTGDSSCVSEKQSNPTQRSCLKTEN